MEEMQLKTSERIYHSSISWYIRNYFKNAVRVNTIIKSPEFVTNLRGCIKWQLQLLARRQYGETYITDCILRRSPSCNGPRHIVVKVRLRMMDSEEKLLGDMTEDFSFYPGTAVALSTWDIYEIVENVARSTCYFNGNITIFCDILQDFPLHYRLSDTDADLSALSNDLRAFYMIGNLTDLDLKVGKETFSVHTAIVKARSPKLAQILNDDPSLREINLTDSCSTPLIKGLIVYWYSGDLDKLPKIPSCSSAAEIRLMKQLELKPFVYPELIKIHTKIKVSKRSISWVIQDIQFCERLRHLQRGKGYVYKCEDLPWKLHIYPRGIEGDANYFTMTIIEEARFNTKYLELFLKDESGSEYCCTRLNVRQDTNRMYTFLKFVTHDEFASLCDILLKRNILRIGCRIKYASGYLQQDARKFHFYEDFSSNEQHPYMNLANDMKLLFQSAEMSDISLKTGDRIFKVHSRILAARSRYFESLFFHPEYETSKYRIIKLDDVQPDDLDKILKYVYYAEKITLNSDLALKLYPVFCKYKITRLQNLCSDYLQNNISEKNALNILKLADEFHNRYLKHTAQHFIQDNWDQISKTENWLRLLNTNDKLVSDILRLIRNNTDVKIGI